MLRKNEIPLSAKKGGFTQMGMILDLDRDFGQSLESFLDLLSRIFIIDQFAGQIFIIGSQVEMTVSAQVEEDDFGLTALLCRPGLHRWRPG